MSNHTMNTDSVSDDEWETEDPNLLNNPELLYRECAKLPPPDTINPGESTDFWESIKMTRELILNHNFVIDALGKMDEFRGRKDTARNVLENMINVFEADCRNDVEKYELAWQAEVKSKIFSPQSADRIQKWKVALKLFLESYMKIRDYIPKETENNEEQQQIDAEKEMCNYLPIIVEELESFLCSTET